MAINFNGATLANNIDAVVFNGTAVSKVMFNGTEVWAKSVALKWSGNSIATQTGIAVSDNLFRAVHYGHGSSWITTQANGTFVGDSAAGGANDGGIVLSTSNNLVRVIMAGMPAGAWVTYTLANKAFTGSSKSGWAITESYGTFMSYYHLQTSGGLIRFYLEESDGDQSGAYIGLK